MAPKEDLLVAKYWYSPGILISDLCDRRCNEEIRFRRAWFMTAGGHFVVVKLKCLLRRSNGD